MNFKSFLLSINELKGNSRSREEDNSHHYRDYNNFLHKKLVGLIHDLECIMKNRYFSITEISPSRCGTEPLSRHVIHGVVSCLY